MKMNVVNNIGYLTVAADNKDQETAAAIYAVMFSLYKSGELTADPQEVCGEIADVLDALRAGKDVDINDVGDIFFSPAGAE